MGIVCFTFAVFLYGSVSLAFTEKCSLPIPQEDPDISKMTDTVWYLEVQTNDPVAADVTCVRVYNITKSSAGFNASTDEFGAGSDRTDFISHFTRQRLGVYHENNEDEPSLEAAHEHTLEGKFNAEARKMGVNDLAILRMYSILKLETITLKHNLDRHNRYMDQKDISSILSKFKNWIFMFRVQYGPTDMYNPSKKWEEVLNLDG
ncbi:uncharacterized protein LOC120337117 [Styela clava]